MIDVKKVLVGLTAVSIMCIAPGYGLRAQDNTGLTPQEKKGKWGYVNQAGKKVVSFKYEAAEAFSERLALVRLKGKWGYVNERGKEVIPLIYNNAGDFLGGIAVVQLNDQFAVINRTGKIVSSVYDKIEEFSEEVAIVQLMDQFVFIDKTGKKISSVYDRIGEFSDGLAAIKKEDKIGFIDRSGNEIIPPKFDMVIKKENGGITSSQIFDISYFQFTNGRVKVILNGKFGILDKAGKEVAPFKYDLIGKFSDDGKAIVQSGEDIKYMDENGVESDLTSRWPDFPIKLNGDKITVVDLEISKKDDKTAIVLYGIGLNPLAMTVGSKGLEAEKMPVVIFTADGQEYTSNRGSVGILSMSYYYETSAEPETVFIFMKDNPDEKIQIHCK
jgi:hypothetical protein